jgi:TM2 domain-containing membrane protein YozV
MFCAQCGAPNDAPARFCFKCGAPLSSQGPAAPTADPRVRGGSPPVAAPESRIATGKNPALATIVSLFIPGVGQFINGDMKKGGVMLVLALLLGALTAGLAWLGVAIWSAVDAYRVATGTAQRW